MRLPFPERLPLFSVFCFCIVLFVIQQMEGTSLLFSSCTFFFTLIAAIAFNTVGGVTRASGGFILAYTVLVALFGIVYKALLGEPGQANMLQPERTIEVYVGSACAMLLVAYLTRKFTLKKSLFPLFRSNADLGRAAIGCLLVGAAGQLYSTFSSERPAPGSILAAFYQLDSFLPLSMILGVIYEIRKSGGRRSINAVVLIAGFLQLATGLIGYSKQGIIGPFAIWAFAAASQRYKVSIAQVAGLLVTFAFIVYYLVPYSQVGRAYLTGSTFSQNVKIRIFLLSHLDLVRKAESQMTEQFLSRYDVTVFRYYSQPQGFADRLTMIAPDDAIINATENGAVFGLFPTIFSFENIIPHFLWPSKPTIIFGNIYAHEVGILTDEDDVTTGISFSPAGEAYHEAKWVGILVVFPALLLMLFLITDSCCGDTRESPFALLALIVFLHSAPEGGVFDIVRQSTMGILTLLVASVLSVKMIPILADLFVGPAKKNHRRTPLPASLDPAPFATAATEPDLRTMAALPSPYRWSKPESRGSL